MKYNIYLYQNRTHISIYNIKYFNQNNISTYVTYGNGLHAYIK